MITHLIHLISGSTGAGKTTYALELCEEIKAVRFSIDDWMTALFWMDSPQPLDGSWSMERVERCIKQIWATAAQVAARQIPCVLDMGFTRMSELARVLELARKAGLSAQLHVLDVPVEERWRRVEARNAKKGETYQLSFDVTREMFDFVEAMWEPPTEEEMARCNGVRIGPPR